MYCVSFTESSGLSVGAVVGIVIGGVCMIYSYVVHQSRFKKTNNMAFRCAPLMYFFSNASENYTVGILIAAIASGVVFYLRRQRAKRRRPSYDRSDMMMMSDRSQNSSNVSGFL